MWAKLLDLVVGSLLKYVVHYLAVILPAAADEWKRKKLQEIAQREAQRKLDEVNKNPASTVDQVGEAYENKINSGN